MLGRQQAVVGAEHSEVQTSQVGQARPVARARVALSAASKAEGQEGELAQGVLQELGRPHGDPGS